MASTSTRRRSARRLRLAGPNSATIVISRTPRGAIAAVVEQGLNGSGQLARERVIDQSGYAVFSQTEMWLRLSPVNELAIASRSVVASRSGLPIEP